MRHGARGARVDVEVFDGLRHDLFHEARAEEATGRVRLARPAPAALTQMQFAAGLRTMSPP